MFLVAPRTADQSRADSLQAIRASEDPAGAHGTALDHSLWNARDRQRELDALIADNTRLRDALADAHSLIDVLQDQLAGVEA